MKNVLVTGANGHLGYNLVKMLKEQGYHVKAGVRNIHDTDKTVHLKKLGAELVEADILKPEQLENAMKSVDGVFHAAAVFELNAKNPWKDVQEPTIQGSQNVLEAASRKKIKKLIYISSIAAVGTIARGEKPLDEFSWNERAIEPYAQAKTIAEKKAWEFSKENNLNMIAILPATMIGPGFFRNTPSTKMFDMLLKNEIPAALPFHFNFIDVRDVALAAILAYESASAQGRYILADETLSVSEVFKKVKQLLPELKVPRTVFPLRLAGLLPFIDWLGNKLQGTPRQMSRELVKEYAGRYQLFDTSRVKNELAWAPQRSMNQTFMDMIDWLKNDFRPTRLNY